MTEHIHPNEDYYEDTEYISCSMIKAYAKCPYYYYRRYVLMDYDQEETDYFLIGQALDTYITEGELAFAERFEVVDRRSPGATKTQLTKTQMHLVKSLLRELNRQPIFKKYDFRMKNNQPVVYAELEGGVKVKARLDNLDDQRLILTDIKTTKSLSTFDPMMYGLQMAWYRKILRILRGKDYEVHLIVVDKTAVPRSRFYIFDPYTLDAFEEDMDRMLAPLVEARRTNSYIPKELENPNELHDCPTYDLCPYSIQKAHVRI